MVDQFAQFRFLIRVQVKTQAFSVTFIHEEVGLNWIKSHWIWIRVRFTFSSLDPSWSFPLAWIEFYELSSYFSSFGSSSFAVGWTHPWNRGKKFFRPGRRLTVETVLRFPLPSYKSRCRSISIDPSLVHLQIWFVFGQVDWFQAPIWWETKILPMKFLSFKLHESNNFFNFSSSTSASILLLLAATWMYSWK